MAMEAASFRLEGLGCSCEVGIVEKRLKKLKGVQDYEVNAFTNRLKVLFDPAAVSVVDIQAAVGKAGREGCAPGVRLTVRHSASSQDQE